ncbi:MAG: isochorismatase family protein, partial [Pseudomonadota bacterium]
DGAEMHSGLEATRADLVIRKGFRAEIDSYSAFFENDHSTVTGLTGYLRERGVEAVTLVGLALDFCVKFSALDAVTQGFHARVVEDACRAIDLDGSRAAAMHEMRAAGVGILQSTDL